MCARGRRDKAFMCSVNSHCYVGTLLSTAISVYLLEAARNCGLFSDEDYTEGALYSKPQNHLALNVLPRSVVFSIKFHSCQSQSMSFHVDLASADYIFSREF